MSERGSFVTQYFYCKDCFAGVHRALVNVSRTAGTVELITAIGDLIIAGKTHEFSYILDHELTDAIEAHICHHVRIAILSDRGTVDLDGDLWKGKEHGRIVTIAPRRP